MHVRIKLNFFKLVWGGVESNWVHSAMRPIVPAPDDYDDGEIGGMIGRGNRSTRRKPVLVPLCPPQTPRAARTRTRAPATNRLSYGTAIHVRNKNKICRR
jgi:hypothetical protein